MKRALCVWLPNWPLQRLAAARAELSGRPVVLYELHSSGGAKVAAYAPCLGAAAGCHAHARVSMLAQGQAWHPEIEPHARVSMPKHTVGGASGLNDDPTGIRPGMPLAEATALAGSTPLHLEPVDPLADRLALEELVEWCRRFSPTVGLEEGAAPESLLLDATGLAPLFGGEEAFARHVAGAFQNRGLAVRVALADTLGAAWAMAHFAPAEFSTGCHAHAGVSMLAQGQAWHPEIQSGATDDLSARGHTVGIASGLNHFFTGYHVVIVPPGQSHDVLAPLPSAALRLPPETCGLLAELGLRRIGALMALRRETLLARFGPLVLERIDQAHGAAPEAIGARPLPPEWTFEWLFEHPTSRSEAICGAVDHLVARACAALARTRQGMLRLECRFEPERGSHQRLAVGFYRATASERHASEVVQLKLERLSFREPIVAIRVNVPAVDRLEFRQREFFAPEANREAPRELAALVDRLTSRLGTHAVLRPWLLADAQPEFACQYRPLHHLPLPLWERAGVKGKKKRTTTRQARGATYMNSQADVAGASLQTNPRQNSPLTPDPSPTRGEGRKEHSLTRGEGGTDQQGRVGDRPLQLESRPRALAVLAIVPQGPPVKFQLAGRDERIVRAWGPERIETGWWRGRSVRRDYYQVETAEGARYWLFRELATGRWFLHGSFE